MIDHIALLVRSLEPALKRAAVLNLTQGSIDSFPGEGTREVYLGDEDRGARLLLMEPIGEAGPYSRAMARRGPGLHHVALRVAEVRPFLDDLQGWLLHTRSFSTWEASQTVWLARPGIGTLIEVHQNAETLGDPVVTRVEVEAPADASPLLEGLGIQRAEGSARLWVGGEAVQVGDLI